MSRPSGTPPRIDGCYREPCQPATREREVHALAVPAGAHDNCSRAAKRRRTRIGTCWHSRIAGQGRRSVAGGCTLPGRRYSPAGKLKRRNSPRSFVVAETPDAARVVWLPNSHPTHRVHLRGEHPVAVLVLNAALDGTRSLQANRHLHRSPCGDRRLLPSLKRHEPAHRVHVEVVRTSRKIREFEAAVDICFDLPRDMDIRAVRTFRSAVNPG